jgi:hypothetical protein
MTSTERTNVMLRITTTLILLLLCGGLSAQTFEDQVMELLNIERWDNGALPPLKRSDLLDTSAGTHSSNMATRNFFAHCDLDTGDQFWDRIIDAGYTSYFYIAENIAAGQNTPSWVVDAWMASAGHRANILSTDFYEVGVGWVYDSTDTNNVRRDSTGDCVSDSTSGPWYHYWTLNFGRRSMSYPVVINREAYQTSSRNVDLYLYGGFWATEMRIRNESGVFTDWQPFQAEVAWQLSPGSGLREVFVEIRDAVNTAYASDTIISTDISNDIFSDSFETGDLSRWSVTVP